MRPDGLQQMAINISSLNTQDSATFKLYNFIEIYNVIVFYDCYIYFNDIDGAANSTNSLFSQVSFTLPGTQIAINRDSGIPTLIGLWGAGRYLFNEPIVTNSFSIGKINSSPNVIFFYKNYIA